MRIIGTRNLHDFQRWSTLITHSSDIDLADVLFLNLDLDLYSSDRNPNLRSLIVLREFDNGSLVQTT